MRYILNEKFILEERYILNEADSDLDLNPTQTSQTTTAPNKQGQDWTAIYKNCKTREDFDKFWKDYYSSEWGQNAEKVKSLGKAFQIEIDEYGFSPILNPCINFLKSYINIITKETYPYFHNALASGLLTDEDVFGKGKFKRYNLIFNEDLYKHSGAEITEYLTAQNKLKSNLYYTTNAALKQSASTADGLKKIFANIMFNADKISTDADLFNSAAAELPDTEAKPYNKSISAVTRVQEVIQTYVTKEETSAISDKDISDILNKSKYNNQDKAKQALKYLVDYFAMRKQAPIRALLKLISPELANIADVPIENKFEFADDFGLDKDYQTDQIISLLKGLARNAGLDLSNKK